MGYNLKNARNGNSASKIPQWPSLRPLEFIKFIRRFESFGKFRGFIWKMLLENKALLSDNFFHTNFLIPLKIQTVMNSYSLMMGASNLAIVIYSRGPARINSNKRHGPKSNDSPNEIVTNDGQGQMYVAQFPTAM